MCINDTKKKVIWECQMLHTSTTIPEADKNLVHLQVATETIPIEPILLLMTFTKSFICHLSLFLLIMWLENTGTLSPFSETFLTQRLQNHSFNLLIGSRIPASLTSFLNF